MSKGIICLFWQLVWLWGSPRVGYIIHVMTNVERGKLQNIDEERRQGIERNIRDEYSDMQKKH